jgi:hypothetical protein
MNIGDQIILKNNVEAIIIEINDDSVMCVLIPTSKKMEVKKSDIVFVQKNIFN